MIYYVIPRELADKHYDEFKKRFEGVDGVEVIIDRRFRERRVSDEGGEHSRAPGPPAPASGRDPRSLTAWSRSTSWLP